MAQRLNGQTSGYVELDAPAVAGSNTLVLPTNNGSSGDYLQTDGSGGLSWGTLPDNLTFGTAIDISGQNTVTFSNIPSNTKRITLIISQLQCAYTSDRPIVRIGSGGSTATTGYDSVGAYGSVHANSTDGFLIYFWGGSGTNGYILMSIENIDGNTWVSTHAGAGVSWASLNGGGAITLSGTLDTLEFLHYPSNNFAQGTVNVIYEAA